MRRRTIRGAFAGVALALALALTGCGSDGKKAEPKVDNPKNSPALQPKTPGTGGPGQPSGPKGSSE